MTQHTPGPWNFAKSDDSRDYLISDGPLDNGPPLRIPHGTNWLATIKPVSSEDHHQANARLIAAAPELLEALRAVVRAADIQEGEAEEMGWISVEIPRHVIATARKAIAKTEGK